MKQKVITGLLLSITLNICNAQAANSMSIKTLSYPVIILGVFVGVFFIYKKQFTNVIAPSHPSWSTNID